MSWFGSDRGGRGSHHEQPVQRQRREGHLQGGQDQQHDGAGRVPGDDRERLHNLV